jgi:hypothetical protein
MASTFHPAQVAQFHPAPTGNREFLTYLFSEVLGNSAYLTDGVQRAPRA